MFNDLIDVHLHLYYLEPSIYLLNKIRKVYSGKVYLSFNKNGHYNKEIQQHASKIFDSLDIAYVTNLGNDQYGFFHSFQKNKNPKDWIFYAHDKTIKRIDWLDEIIDPIFEDKKIIEKLGDEKIGLISSSVYPHYQQLLSENNLTELSKNKDYSRRLKIIQARHTLTWYRELQYILLTNTGLIDADNLNPFFTAGNMFIARNSVVKISHDCVHESFFENYYREDGNVEHALERFYYYVSLCLKYKNYFVELEEEKND